ncbi:hypothetical protein evm_004387 [Chilo suppressalis]|nr:hypothetical protein evm_004387 [Chilo suppressalis]
MQSVTKQDLQKLLEILTYTDDSDTQVKIFSILAVTLISNNDFSDIIITHYVIYKIIRAVLIQHIPSKTAITLNFISSMLYIEEEEGLTRKKSLVLYAQNMIRTSGCLLAMCNIFTSPMMHQETWSALCRCIAESCKNSHENQMYCSHLVPQTVRKCIQGDTEVILALTSLLADNPRNLQLFLECNGISIFNRELLQHDICLHLLDMLVQNIPIESLKLLHQRVNEHLQYFKTFYGTKTRVGQWATLILYHLNTRVKGLEEKERSYFDLQNKNINKASNISDGLLLKPQCDETAKLIQNVITEIYQYNTNIAKKNPVFRTAKALSIFDKTTKYSNANNNVFVKCTGLYKSKNKNQSRQVSRISNNDSDKDMTFSFLLKQPLQDSRLNVNNIVNSNLQKYETTLSQKLPIQVNITESHSNINYPTCLNRAEIPKDKLNNQLYESNALDFKPNFVSTPKHKHRSMNLTNSSRLSRQSLKTIRKTNFRNDEFKVNGKMTKDMETSQMQSIRHRSISSRLFDAINDSCTTLVKTVKSIFKTKGSKKKVNEQVIGADHSCSYSFTEYMRKRDAGLIDGKTENTSAISESRNVENCKTCNDTRQLKRKIMSDDCLRDTIRKLKLGINLYGCDFKKISRTMWPRENYMTPEVLYNLYRKIIIK